MTSVKAYQKAVDFLRRMHWHLQFTPDVNRHSVIAYQVALQALEQHQSLEGIEAVKGIGATMQEHFRVIASGKTPKRLREIEGNGPPFTVSELTRIPGVGIKTAEKLYTEYKITSLADLDAKIKAHKIVDPKLVAAYLDHGAVNERIPRTVIEHNIAPVLAAIRKVIGSAQLEMVGSFRRYRADIRDVDVLIGTDDIGVMKSVVETAKTFADQVRLMDREGTKKAEVQILIAGKQRKLDLYFVNPRSWGSALMHFTGPARYNVAIRELAKKRGLKVNQYGVTDLATKKIKRFETEPRMCKYLGIPYLDPELRDLGADLNRVKSNELESLLTMKSVKGDFHVHTTESDGKAGVEALVRHLLTSRYKFLGISNHSQGTGGGMNAETATKHHAWIRSFIRKTKYKKAGVDKRARVLCGAEVDVNVEGELDYDAKTLKTLDYVIIAIHHKQDFKPTERLLQAIETVHELGVPAIIAHPTNRIIGYRPESMVTWNPVFVKCADYGIALEVNGQSDRLDLPEQLIERARGFGCWFVVSSDFHGENPKDRVKLLEQAVMQARRGWLTKDVVVNASNKLLAKWLGAKSYWTMLGKEN